MKKIIDQLRLILPTISFQEGDLFYWSPKESTITYKSCLEGPTDSWSLLHEAAHAVLKHQNYSSDLGLLLLEVEAWEKAKLLGKDLGITIDEDHIQDCLDTYRDWLHQRSTCPRCSVVSMQVSPQEYLCHNCDARWQVSASRFCRPYRLMNHSSKIKSRPGNSQATFQ